MYIRMTRIPTANQREQRTVPEAFSGGLSFIAFEVVKGLLARIDACQWTDSQRLGLQGKTRYAFGVCSLASFSPNQALYYSVPDSTEQEADGKGSLK